jgi:hypothetical protein
MKRRPHNEKASLVAKLKAARDRKIARDIWCGNNGGSTWLWCTISWIGMSQPARS